MRDTNLLLMSGLLSIGAFLSAPSASAASPGVPTQIKITSSSGQSVLKWKAVPGADGYHVKRSLTENGQYSLLGSPTKSAFTDTQVSNAGTYYYKVSTISPSGEESHDSPPVSIHPASALGKPGHLKATQTSSAVALTWAPVKGATHYRVRRALQADGPYEVDPSSSMKALNPDAATHFVAAGLNQDQTYYFQIIALNEAGEESSPSSATSIKFHLMPPASLAAPRVQTGNTGIELSWSSLRSATSYEVKRSNSKDGAYSLVSSSLKEPRFSDRSVTIGQTYYYKVAALNEAGESKDSPASLPVELKTPLLEEFETTLSANNGQIELQWQVVPGAALYSVERAISGSHQFTQIAGGTIPLSETRYEDPTVTNGQAYVYRVLAHDTSGKAIASSKDLIAKPMRNQSAGFSAKVISASGSLSIDWPMQKNAKAYLVKRSNIPTGPYALISDKLPGNHFNDANVTSDQSYYYVVVALNAQGQEYASSSPVVGTASGLVDSVSWLPPKIGRSKVKLQWAPVAGAQAYNVKRSLAAEGPFTNVASRVSDTMFVDSGLSGGETYFYVVSALKEGAESKNSKPLSITARGKEKNTSSRE